MFTKTNMSFGVNEVLLASVLGSVVFSVFAAQPLVIVGVTGTKTIRTSVNHLPGVCRADYRLQLHSVRHHNSKRYQLLCIHVLDWIVFLSSYCKCLAVADDP